MEGWSNISMPQGKKAQGEGGIDGVVKKYESGGGGHCPPDCLPLAYSRIHLKNLVDKWGKRVVTC